ncbi:unnamed protein product [Anisakis simplex]|uniref:PH domain-containing protein n=1 Tax=Anisakis simplex TaxID=6269 RepID=A0A158PP26_ANISI|nr:unnamed protein product [Anisakis simplex]
MDSLSHRQHRSTNSVVSAVEEEAGVLKSGLVTAGFTPIKSKKTYYAVLLERALELHESEKSQKKRRHAKYLIDLSICFNINRHFDSRLKYCVSVMTPDETLLLRGETEKISEEWYDVLMSAVIPARALRLGRPVQASEFFECVWDVVLVDNPKLKKPVPNPEKMPNICQKEPSLCGPQRLCFYPHTIILCKRSIEPASIQHLPASGIPPFRDTDFVEFPRKFVASFGCQEKFFIMRMGRSSPSGSAEVWAQCESEEIAGDIHIKLNKIIERESEKKKQMVNGPMLRASQSANTHSHHERIHAIASRHRIGSQSTNPNHTGSELTLRERRAQLRDSKAALESFEEMMDTPLTPLFVFDASTQRCGRYSSPGSFSGSATIESARRRCNANMMNTSGSSWSSSACMMPMRAHSITGTSCSTSTSAPAASLLRTMTPKSAGVIAEEIPLGAFRPVNMNNHRSSLTSSSAAEETEDSGGTLRIIDTDEHSISSKTAHDREIAATIDRMLPDDIKQRCSLSSSNEHHQFESCSSSVRATHSDDTDDHNDNCSYSAACSSSTNDEFISSTPGDTSEDASGENMEYAPMEMHSWSSGSTSHLAVPIPFEQQYNLEEIRSYVSDSSDSCYSSLAPNAAPRTFSFGSQQPQRHIARRQHHLVDDGSLLQESVASSSMQNGVYQRANETSHSMHTSSSEDPRKRAFSLGSKSWFPKPFRKFSRELVSRAHRHSNTSAGSLGGSFGANSTTHAHTLHTTTVTSSAHPVQTPIQAYIAPDPYPSSRVRSESTGSGRSTPYMHRSGGAMTVDHIQLDFGSNNAPLGRSGSGSVHSIESPARSRTSSFGCSQRFVQSIRDPGDIVLHTVDVNDSEQQPLTHVIHPHHRCSRDDKNTLLRHQQSISNGDYVDRDVGTDEYVLSDAGTLHELSRELHSCLPIASCSSSLCDDSQVGNQPNFTDPRSSQVFETIEENISGRSSRASSVRSSNFDEDEDEDKKSWSSRAVKGSETDITRADFGEHCTKRDYGLSNEPQSQNQSQQIDRQPNDKQQQSSSNISDRSLNSRPFNTNDIVPSNHISGNISNHKNVSVTNENDVLNNDKRYRLKCRDDSDLRYVLLDLTGAHASNRIRRKRSKSSSICIGGGNLEYAQLHPLPLTTPLPNKTLL